MTTADWALIISIGSLGLSLASFIWNVWSKFIYPKPNVDVSFGFMTILTLGAGSADEHVLSLTATNMGPADVTLYSALTVGKRGWKLWKFWKRQGNYGLLNPLHNYPMQTAHTIGPFGGGLPKKVAVGEQFTVHFVPDHEGLARDDVYRVGFSDTFGRFHWAPRASLKRARIHIRAACDKTGKNYRKHQD